MDGTWITAMRTGAVAAVTCGLLKKQQTKSYSFIGLGNMARAVLLCLNAAAKNEPLEIKLLKYKDQHNDFIKRFSRFKNITFQVYDSVPMLIRNSDVIISCVTIMKTDFTKDTDYSEGVLVIPVHTMGFQNCDLFFDKIYCDDIGHIKNFKYFNRYKNCDEISNIILGRNRGRESEKERIIVYNIGISLHDIFFASKIYDLCGDMPEKKVISLQPPDMERYWV
jgi:ornithine cyclodeaminase/alanine dehydrogenase-like protein (mu-crystallin family)